MIRIALLVLFSLGIPLQAGVVVQPDLLVSYEALAGDEFAPSFSGPRVTASPLNTFDSFATLEPGIAFPESVFLQLELAAATPAAAVANDQFFQLTVSPLGGEAFRFQSLQFQVASGGASSPRGWVVRSSHDGFGSDLASADATTVAPSFAAVQVDLSQLPAASQGTTFRIYGYAPAAVQEGLFFDTIQLTGSVIPEPSLPALAAVAGLLLLVRRKR